MVEAISKAYNKDTVFIAGHSGTKFPVTCAQADLMVMRDYITSLLAFVTTQIKAGKSRDEIIAMKDVLKGFDDHGPFIRLAFDLPPGAYATSALREAFGDGLVDASRAEAGEAPRDAARS